MVSFEELLLSVLLSGFFELSDTEVSGAALSAAWVSVLSVSAADDPETSEAADFELSAVLLDEPQAVSISIDAAITVKSIFLIFMVFPPFAPARWDFSFCAAGCFILFLSYHSFTQITNTYIKYPAMPGSYILKTLPSF